MTGRAVVVVDPYSSGAQLAGALRGAGFEPVGVVSWPLPPPVYTSAYRPGDFATLLAAARDPGPLLRELSALDPLAVVPGAESGVTLADTLAARLVPDLANDPRTGPARRHKGHMATALEAAGVPAIRTLSTSAPAEAVAWVAAQGLAGRDLVVKPATSGGTEDVTLLPAGAGLAVAVGRLLGTVNVLGLPNDEVVVQERVTGTEYVVDTFTADGRHAVTNICRYRKVGNATSFAVYESVEFLPYDAPGNADLVGYVGRVLDALGVRFGAAHSEVMMTAGGPVLVETGVRLAGGGLPGLCELATGDSGVHRLVRYLAGRRDEPLDYRLDWHVSSVYFIVPRAGTVTNTAAYQAVRRLPSCRLMRLNVADGDRVSATVDLLSTMRLGWAVLAHHDPAQVERDHAAIREIEKELCIEPDP